MLRNPIDRIGLAIVAGISVIGYFGGIRPLLAHHADRLITERAIAGKADRLDGFNAELAGAEQRVNRLEREVAGYREGFTASHRVNKRLGEVAELAELMGIAVDSITPGEEVVTDSYRLRPISITGRGDPEAVARLLSELRSVFPDMGARSFSVSAQGDGSASLSAELVWFAGGADRAGGAAERGG